MYQEATKDKYLVIRGGYPAGGQYGWTDWNGTYGLWTRTGYTTKSDCDSSGNCPTPGLDDLTALNTKFDLAYTNHGIYHWHGHPGSKVGVSWQGLDDPNSIFNQHVNYIAGKTYAWYAG